MTRIINEKETVKEPRQRSAAGGETRLEYVEVERSKHFQDVRRHDLVNALSLAPTYYFYRSEGEVRARRMVYGQQFVKHRREYDSPVGWWTEVLLGPQGPRKD